ncbi:MAG: glycosyltransferase family 4 protein [Pseudomonadota bacterium]
MAKLTVQGLGPAMASKIIVVMKGYPRLSETFIAQELLGLQEAGVDFEIVALRRPHDAARHPVHAAITAPVHYLPEYLHEAPFEVAIAVVRALMTWRGWRAAQIFLRDLARDRTRNRVRRFGQAAVLAQRLPRGTGHLYAHFLHTPASVTRYTSIMRGLSWSCSAHAKDIYTSPDWDLREKLASMAWLVTCTATNVVHLTDIAIPGDREKISLLYHGLDLARFPSPPEKTGQPSMLTILSVGRAVAKKGFDDLLMALAGLGSDHDWRFEHVGGGEELAALKVLAEEKGISDRCVWHGPMAQSEVLAAYGRADLFVLASRIAEDGDRDGLPNVLMEAQSQRLACVSTRVSAIPELIVDGKTGVLVPPRDPDALRNAIAELLADPARRHALAKAGEVRVRDYFSHEAGIAALTERFGVAMASGNPLGAADIEGSQQEAPLDARSARDAA